MSDARNNPTGTNGWRGVALVAITYVYFLIFAQFAFLRRLEELGLVASGLKAVLAAMAVGGVLISWFAWRLAPNVPVAKRMLAGFGGCAIGALLTLAPLSQSTAAGVALWIGAALGWLTVTLVSNLRLWMGTRQPLVRVGLGTGAGYFLCNVPALFDAAPRIQSVTAAMLCLAGAVIVMLPSQSAERADRAGDALPAPDEQRAAGRGLGQALVWFTALIWLDSAAFFIIQNTPVLKADTWAGDAPLWRNAVVHFAAALGGGWLLTRRGLTWTAGAAFGGLAFACLCLGPARNPQLAALLYPVAVSIYSAALVGYPAFLSGARDDARRTLIAGRIYALAGWIGSALGIGMAQDLGRIPVAFIIAASAAFFAPWLWRWARERRREMLFVAAIFGTGAAIHQATISATVRPPSALSAIGRGRRVYVSEGCLHCHSQYARPGTHDEIWWGPPSDPETVLREAPPLIGNRRQGPDLANVGARRSPAWLKAHFLAPQRLSADSPMPGYAHLFADARGDDLVAYVASLGQTNLLARLAGSAEWKLTDAAIAVGARRDGAALLRRHCATCHHADGAARRNWPAPFVREPPDLARGPFTQLPPEADAKWRLNRVAEIIKFGLPFTEMPGHEYLPDDAVAALALAVGSAAATNTHENPAR